jgi:ElaB/YqjD/DUF883 family membrane-anchored ribosome-binding protein
VSRATPIEQPNATTDDGMERLTTGAHKGINAGADAVHPVIDRLASSAHRAIDSADNAANQATDTLAKAGSKAGATGKEYYTAGTGYMRDHPVLTLGVVVATGYLLSRLFAR